MEEARKRKKGVELDWNELLEDDSEPLSLVVVKTGARKAAKNSEPENRGGGEDEQAHIDDFHHMSDRELKEYLDRQRRTLESLRSRLPDNGKKLRDKIMLVEAERERRLRLRAHKDDDDGYEKPTQSRDFNCVGPSDFERGAPSHEQILQLSFAASFHKKLEDKDCRAVNAFGKESSIFHRCDHRKLRDNKQFDLRGRKKSRLSSRGTPFKCPNNVSIDDDKQISSNGYQEGRLPASSPRENDLYGFSSKRRNASKLQPSIISKPKNTVVLLDEEESQLKETKIQDEQIDDCMKEAKIYYPSRNDPESVEIYYSDIECLAPEAYLSSTIMNFYIRYLQQQKLPADRARCDYHVFNTYFYSKLKEAVLFKRDKETLFVKFRRWWKGVNIFEKAYILLPIHDNLHWSLVIICIPDKVDESGPILLHLDSLGLHFSKSIFDNIKSFLEEEWKCLNQGEAPSDLPIADKIWKNLPRRIFEKKITVPQQNNDYDCGVFVLFFMERFIEEAPERLKKEDLAMFGKQWFKPEEASGLRRKIQKLLTEEFKNACEDGIISDS